MKEHYKIKVMLVNDKTGKKETILEEDTKNVVILADSLTKNGLVLTYASGLTNGDIIGLLLTDPDMRKAVKYANTYMAMEREKELAERIKGREQ
jgi:hypothetical protein